MTDQHPTAPLVELHGLTPAEAAQIVVAAPLPERAGFRELPASDGLRHFELVRVD